MTSTARERALAALAHLTPAERLAAVSRRLRGERAGPLAHLDAGSEGEPGEGRIDSSLLETVCGHALDGARGAIFTPAREARILAAFGLAHAAQRRGGPAAGDAVAALLAGTPDRPLARALDGALVLDPACGGGALLAAAHALASGVGAQLVMRGFDVQQLAAEAARERLALLGADAQIRRADAFVTSWPEAALVLANPPFVRHEAIPAAEKARAARASGLSRQADLSAHFVRVTLARAPVAALVWPRALDVSRSAAPLVSDARARGGFVLRLRSRAAGSFAASIDTLFAVWVEGADDVAAAEATVPLAELTDEEIVALARAAGGPRIRISRPPPAPPRGIVRVGDVCGVRFGTKTGCNAFFHLKPLGADRFLSELAGEVRLVPEDVTPLLAALREARAPEWAEPRKVLFRPQGHQGHRTQRLSAAAARYVAVGEAAGVHLRPTCAARSPWWRLAPGRGPAPVLYPAKVGARAFAFLNERGLWEDKKWHALFPHDLPAWEIAVVLSATPVRLAIDEGARQLTGAQAIADVDCRVLAAAPFPPPGALASAERSLSALRVELARDRVTTELRSMLERPAQRELDAIVGHALGFSPSDVARSRRTLIDRVEARVAHGAAVKSAIR